MLSVFCALCQVQLGVDLTAKAAEVHRQLQELAKVKSGRTQKRLQEAARIALEGGLDGKMLCRFTPDELLHFFDQEGPGDPPITDITIKLIREELVVGACFILARYRRANPR